MKPATGRQLAKLRELSISHDNDISLEEAAELLRSAIPQIGRSIDVSKIQTAIAVESEGDPGPGRQWQQ